MERTIYLVEDLEFKSKFDGLSLYKVGYTKQSLFSRIRGLQNWQNLKVLYSTTDKEVGEYELSKKVKSDINGFNCFSGWKYVDYMVKTLNKDIAEYLENKYIPEKGTEFRKFGGGLTEYFIGKDWENSHPYYNSIISKISEYLKSEDGIEQNQLIVERVRLIEENNKQREKNYEKIL